MPLMHYYAAPYQRLNSGTSENELKPDSSESKDPIVPSTDRPKRVDPFELFVAGKLRIIEASIEQIHQEVESREKLRDAFLEAIDKEICVQKELLYQVAPDASSPFTVGDSRRRGSIEKELAALEAEKRKETCSAWKDIANLKKELRALLREHSEEERRQQVLGQ